MEVLVVCTVSDVTIIVSSALDALDQSVWEFFVGNPSLTTLARGVTSIGVLPVLLPLSVFVGVYLWKKTSSPLIGLTPWLAVQVNSIVVASLKEWTNVPRPPQEFWIVEASAGSFPSGHVSNTTAFVVVVVVLFNSVQPTKQRLAILIGVVACVAMAWSRLALNVHWLSDVVAGWCVGAVSALVVVRLVERIKSQRESQLQTRG